MDTNEEDLAIDFTRACRYREQSLAYVRYWLGLDLDTGLATSSSSPVATSIVSVVAASVSKICSRFVAQFRWTASAELKLQPIAEPDYPSKSCLIFKEFGQRVCDKFNTGNDSPYQMR